MIVNKEMVKENSRRYQRRKSVIVNTFWWLLNIFQIWRDKNVIRNEIHNKTKQNKWKKYKSNQNKI